MKTICLFLFVILILSSTQVVAEYYQYTDKYGHSYFTDNPAEIPADQLDRFNRFDSVASEPNSTIEIRPEKSKLEDTSSEKTASAGDGISEWKTTAQLLDQRKNQLQQEFEHLQNEKADLDTKFEKIETAEERSLYGENRQQYNERVDRFEEKRRNLQEEIDQFNVQIKERNVSIRKDK